MLWVVEMPSSLQAHGCIQTLMLWTELMPFSLQAQAPSSQVVALEVIAIGT
jgi:hypothetical protein